MFFSADAEIVEPTPSASPWTPELFRPPRVLCSASRPGTLASTSLFSVNVKLIGGLP